MYLVKTLYILRLLLPNLVCRVPDPGKKIFLSFDDGPTPEITPWVLDQLNLFSAKATFFCLGENVKHNPQLFGRIIAEGHSAGNHSYSHLNGLKVSNQDYFEDIERAGSFIPGKLFRPPFGKMKYSQYRRLKEVYQLVLWDVMPGDFDKKLSKENCLKNVIKHAREGSVIVLHDTLKAEDKLRYVLPEILKYFTNKNFIFSPIY